jgi:hypothetical protein
MLAVWPHLARGGRDMIDAVGIDTQPSSVWCRSNLYRLEETRDPSAPPVPP